MDRTVIKTNKLARLNDIALLSAITIVETDQYIQLAQTVERYISEISPENFVQVMKALEGCAKRVPQFHKAREQLMHLLVLNGTLTTTDESQPVPTEEPAQISEPVEVVEQPVKNNVVNLFDFKKKNVDNPN